jgi:hypothetical protein
MPLTLYDVSIPLLTRALDNLTAILDKAEAHAKEKKIDPATLIEARLAPDMLAFKNQIYLATDSAKGCAARLGGVEIPSYPDTETNFADLKARIAKTSAFLKSVSKDAVAGAEDKTVMLKTRTRTIEFTGRSYVLGFVLPNFYFHVTTAYDILRAQGVPLGKTDYLGAT